MARRARTKANDQTVAVRVTPPPLGGRFAPLTVQDRDRIIEAAFAILERTGMDQCPEPLIALAVECGARRRDNGRICFPRPMIERAIGRAARSVNLPGFVESFGLTIGGGHVHIGTGGAAVQVLDAASMRFHDARLADLYDMMTLVGRAQNVHYGVRPLVARDLPTPLAMDVNTAFACLKACPKPIRGQL